MRGNDDFVTGAEPDSGHRRRERVAATRREREVPDAEILGVARFESFAFITDAVTKQRLGTDHARDRIDLFLSDLVHGSPPEWSRRVSALATDASIAMGPEQLKAAVTGLRFQCSSVKAFRRRTLL